MIEAAALGRRIDDVDDSDTYECRPHHPGEIRSALLGRRLTAAHRRGKTMWVDTSGVGRLEAEGPALGIHLGMAGRIVVTDSHGELVEGGDPRTRNAVPGQTKWNRFTLFFADGGSLVLLDPRRLGRVRLDPDIEALGPDALTITSAQLRGAFARGTAPVKARLLDQSALAGVGNLLADEALWQAKINPARPVRELTPDELNRLGRSLRAALKSATAKGGVHTGKVIAARVKDGVCPRCGAPMVRGTVGGRTTWWCSLEQA